MFVFNDAAAEGQLQAQEREGEQEGQEGQTKKRETHACFILNKPNLSSNVMKCCEGALETECNYLYLRKEYEGDCAGQDNQDSSAWRLLSIAEHTSSKYTLNLAAKFTML